MRGLTMRHPDVPEPLRGTFAGLAHPPVIEHLVKLGVTAVELLPVHAFVDDRHLVAKGLQQLLGLQLDRLLRAGAALPGRRRRSASSRPWSSGCTTPGSR